MSGSNGGADVESLDRMFELMRQMRRCEEEQGMLRALKARFKVAGEDVAAMVAMIRESRRDPDEAIAHERARLRYGRMRNIPFVPGDLFADHEGIHPVPMSHDPWLAEDSGYRAGCGGAAYDTNPYEPGSELFVIWREWWQRGQEYIARRMGPDGEQVTASHQRPRRRRRQSGDAQAANQANPASRASMVGGAAHDPTRVVHVDVEASRIN
jgi:hypothetical protein